MIQEARESLPLRSSVVVKPCLYKVRRSAGSRSCDAMDRLVMAKISAITRHERNPSKAIIRMLLEMMPKRLTFKLSKQRWSSTGEGDLQWLLVNVASILQYTVFLNPRCGQLVTK